MHKESIAVDIKSPEGQEVVRKRAAQGRRGWSRKCLLRPQACP